MTRPWTGRPSNGEFFDFEWKPSTAMRHGVSRSNSSRPANRGASARVAFDHYICAEPDWDGGALYTSVDNGSTWQIFGQNSPQFYDRQHWNNQASPFYQKWVWDGSNQKGGGCGANKSFTHVEGDLSSFGGQDVMLRFSFFSDDFIELDGWYIDNVMVTVPGS